MNGFEKGYRCAEYSESLLAVRDRRELLIKLKGSLDVTMPYGIITAAHNYHPRGITKIQTWKRVLHDGSCESALTYQISTTLAT